MYPVDGATSVGLTPSRRNGTIQFELEIFRLEDFSSPPLGQPHGS